MIECEFIKENMLVETYSGNVNVDDIIILKEYEFAHEKYKDGINIIADLKEAEFSFDSDDSIKLKEFLDTNYNRMLKTKIAILTCGIKRESFFLFIKSINEINAGIRIKLFTDENEMNKWFSESIQ